MSPYFAPFTPSAGLQLENLRPTQVIHNPSYALLKEAALQGEGLERGHPTNFGALSVNTGEFTGRSPEDKYIVRDATTDGTVWWKGNNSSDNKPITPDTWQRLKGLVDKQLTGKKLYVVDAFVGADASIRKAVRVITEVAWQAHFARNMFIDPTAAELEGFAPDYVILSGTNAVNPQWKAQGLNSENFVAFSPTDSMQLIGGTWYGGEIKKGVFSMMNYWLPLEGIASMHCSANRGRDGDVAIFFGLSGTGKTTLSTDPDRALIGDDEHAWGPNGICNIEGGCYAKVIDLDPATEPGIYAAIRDNALLENVSIREDGSVDFSDRNAPMNTRVSYPLSYIDGAVIPSVAGHASSVIFLTADAFGVLPPVSVLTPEQAQYQFLSGYTSKLSGTERGINEPTPTFSAAFGAAFLTVHPTIYAQLLAERMRETGARAYLVNTGWNGAGERIPIPETRRMITAILNGSIHDAETTELPYFGMRMPTALSGVNPDILNPIDTYGEASEWHGKAQRLAGLFVENFTQFTDTPEGRVLVAAGPQLDA